MSTNREKFAGKFVDGTHQYIKAATEGKSRQEILALVQPHTDRMLELAKRVINEEDSDDNGDGEYVPPYSKAERQEVLNLPVWDELKIHYLGLPGYVYLHLEDDPKAIQDKVYELVRQARVAGCKYVRTFLFNGSRAPTEKYMLEALPWEMVVVTEDGKKIKKIDFAKRNELFFKSCAVIEEACKYWKIHHLPTYSMNGYNDDIFDARYNIQKIQGFRSEGALEIKCLFIKDYMSLQDEIRGDNYKHCWEIENEPYHRGDHRLGALIADHHLAMFRVAEVHGTLIGDTVTCSVGSEFAHANFCEHRWFASEQFEGGGRYFGFDEFASRKVKPEYHGCSTIQGLLATGWDKGLGSGWRYLSNNEDGGTLDGNYNPIPWTDYRQGDYQQIYDMCEYANTTAKAHGKSWSFTLFAMDCLVMDTDGVAKETYLINKMNWERYHAPKDVLMDLGM